MGDRYVLSEGTMAKIVQLADEMAHIAANDENLQRTGPFVQNGRSQSVEKWMEEVKDLHRFFIMNNIINTMQGMVNAANKHGVIEVQLPDKPNDPVTVSNKEQMDAAQAHILDHFIASARIDVEIGNRKSAIKNRLEQEAPLAAPELGNLQRMNKEISDWQRRGSRRLDSIIEYQELTREKKLLAKHGAAFHQERLSQIEERMEALSETIRSQFPPRIAEHAPSGKSSSAAHTDEGLGEQPVNFKLRLAALEYAAGNYATHAAGTIPPRIAPIASLSVKGGSRGAAA